MTAHVVDMAQPNRPATTAIEATLPDARWRTIAHIIEARDVAVDLDAVTSDPDWAAQAEHRHGSRAREFVAVFDALSAMTTAGAVDEHG